MPRKKNFTGDLFAADDELFDDTEESSELKPEEPDLPTPPKQTDLVEETEQRGSEQTKGTDITCHTHNKNQTEKTHPLTPTINNSSAGKQKETKSKRLNLLIRPSLLKKFAKIAYMQQTSVNDLINQLIAEHVGKKSETIIEYDRLFNDRNAR